MSVSEQLYATYSELRARLGGELQDLSTAQTILDRVLVVALAERRGLLPRDTLASAVERPGPLWRNFLAVFQAIERGALFRDLEAIERLDVSDATCVELAKLCGHDCDDVSVLGQLFERSIADLERTSKRKVEGIFYTPASVTELLIRETVGRTIADARARAGGDPEALQAALARVRVLDPACGGGALLLAAFDALAQERGLGRAVASENLFGVDKDGEAVEIAKLSLWLRSAELGTGVADLDHNIRQGNSVVDDPRVDASAFDWQRWPAGFDVVIGNPPYVRHELLGAYKDHWSRTFEVYDGSADLFVYFFERGLRLLAPGGRLGFVVSNKWLRGGYATRLRELLAREYTIESLVDFGHAPLFPGADAFPCIITVRRNAPAVDHEMSVTQHQVEPHEFSLLQRTLDEQGWSLEPPAAQALLEKLRRNGVALEDYAAIKPYRGVVTGCNAAFLIDQSTKDRLCREHARSSEILKKYVRGQDVGRWSAQWRERWMIFTRRGIDIDAYPAIEAHLSRYRRQLEPRPQDFDGGEWPGRKPGNYAWYEIQDSTDYHEHFERPKILYQEIQFHPAYALDDVGLYANNKAFLLPSDDPWLLAVLNSPAMWWHNWRVLVHMKDEALSLAGEKMVGVPIPRPSAAQADAVAARVESIVQLSRSVIAANAVVRELLRVEWGVDKPGQALADFSGLGREPFVERVKKRRKKGSPRLSPAAIAELGLLYDEHARPVIDARARILDLERAIAEAVHTAYGLDDSDLALMRATAPPRMPPGW